MPRNASGVYSPPSGTTAVSGSVIASSEFNNFVDDIGSEVTGSLPRDGSAAMTSALPMGGNKITGLAAGSVTGDAATFDQIGSAFFQSGTVMLFQQTSAPVGWTKSVAHNDKALRVVSGTVSSGGSKAFSTLFASGTVTSSHVLSIAEMPAHTHAVTDPGHTHGFNAATEGTNVSPTGGSGKQYAANTSSTTASGTTGITLANAGTGGGHTHIMPLDVNYVDVIFAVKD